MFAWKKRERKLTSKTWKRKRNQRERENFKIGIRTLSPKVDKSLVATTEPVLGSQF